ncbi:hypothetical protein DHB64_07860 [Antarcticibacterium sp. W02-3]|nr:hypothetical protein [Antarcticibacterium sp. W02-3]
MPEVFYSINLKLITSFLPPLKYYFRILLFIPPKNSKPPLSRRSLKINIRLLTGGSSQFS